MQRCVVRSCAVKRVGCASSLSKRRLLVLSLPATSLFRAPYGDVSTTRGASRCNSSCSQLESLKVVLNSLSADVEVIRKQAREDATWLCTESGKTRIRLFYEQFPADKRKVNSRDIVDYIHSRTDPSSTTGIVATSEQIDSQQLAAFRVLSSLLTFPLTLAFGLNKLFASPSLSSSYPNMMLKDRSINVLVLGARAESSLPLIWWQEMLLACDFDDVNIRMIGPELLLDKGRPLQDLLSQNSSLVQSGEGEGESTVRRRRSVSISGCGPSSSSVSPSSDRTALHLHEDLVPLLQWAHVFALFNPGYGSSPCPSSSPSQKAMAMGDWDPTLRLLLQTRKPVLCTAYGHQDLRRGE